MPCVLSLIVASALTSPFSAQLLSEDFSSGVPPVGWVHMNNNGNPTNGWIASANGRAWHEDEQSFLGTSDNTLISPILDFSNATGVELQFDGETNWAVYLANHPSSFGDGVSTMEITTDGGLTWTMVWTDTSLSNGHTYSPNVDLSAWDGLSNIQLGIHYYGTFAQEWWIEEVQIEATGPSTPSYSITGLVGGGTATLTVISASANGSVLVGYSLTGPGPTATIYGLVDMSLPIISLPSLLADGAGVASTTVSVPVAAIGWTIFSQAVDLSSGMLSNPLAEVVM